MFELFSTSVMIVILKNILCTKMDMSTDDHFFPLKMLSFKKSLPPKLVKERQRIESSLMPSPWFKGHYSG